jgi:hypothetical protein
VEIRQRENLNIIEGGEIRVDQRQDKDKKAKTKGKGMGKGKVGHVIRCNVLYDRIMI